MKTFHSNREATNFTVNKGNVKLVKEAQDYSIKYPSTMEGAIQINQVGETINIQVNRDFPHEDPIVINLNGLSECKINVDNGVVNSECLCPIMKVKVNNGTLSAKVSREESGVVTANVKAGVLNNHSDLTDVTNHNSLFGVGIFNNFMGFMNYSGSAGLNTHLELMGNTDYCKASFEVGAGVIDLSS